MKDRYSVQIEPKSKLSSDDWKKLGSMMQNLKDQEQKWIDDFEQKQKPFGRFIIGRIYPKLTIRSSKEMFKDSNILIVARDTNDSDIVGFCAIVADINSSSFICAGLYVEPSNRNHGIASQLLELAKTKCKEEGFDQFSLRVSSKNRPAQKLYKKLGFATTGYLMDCFV